MSEATLETDVEDATPNQEPEAGAGYDPGSILWHCSEDDGGPDVGIQVGLGMGFSLYCGELADATVADHGADPKDCSSGWWIVLYGPEDSRIIGAVTEGYHAQEAMETISLALQKAAEDGVARLPAESGGSGGEAVGPSPGPVTPSELTEIARLSEQVKALEGERDYLLRRWTAAEELACAALHATTDEGGDPLKGWNPDADPEDLREYAYDFRATAEPGPRFETRAEAAELQLSKAEAEMKGLVEALASRLEAQVPITAAYLRDNGINAHFADVLMSHYLDVARDAREALSTYQDKP